MQSRRATITFVFWGATVLALVVQAALAWNRLPENVPANFDLDGSVNSWMSKQGFYIVWGLAIFFVNLWPPLIGPIITKLWTKLPREKINLPNRDYWLATDERREQARAAVVVTSNVGLLGMNVILFFAFRMVEKTALGQDGGAPGLGLFLGGTVAITAWAILYPVATLRVPPPPHPPP